ncbi:ABC transporter ATP-binding protein [Mangrovicoccus sp. HB161399]|uniref:ABC transporter ATP-binding protein n=1 Tax=Mangrovicoccus sp. HB161399 TaxID=2720392 RepID=UPI001552F17A|nr:ABC transporter ATP-binding protein [Mangrovicoccus sp. HB161399]
MARLELNALTKRYGDFHAARDVSLDVPEGEFLVLLGPSGCGKTTTLRMIAGFVEPTAGSISIGGNDVTRLPPWKRNTGLVFQNYALFPHMTVAENVAFGLEMRKMSKAETAEKVRGALDLVQLGHLADRYPRQMSGGQQQRVALARALVFRPDVLLLDEPLSNLDAKLRHEVRIEIRALQQRLGITAVMVTHDQEEALTMSDRLVVMSEGQVRQVGTQRELYETPASRFVAGFVGRSSFLEGELRDGRLVTSGGLAIEVSKPIHGPVTAALRPERIAVSAEPPAEGTNVFPGTVELVSYMGGLIDLHVRLSPSDLVVAQVSNQGGTLPAMGDRVFASLGTPAVFPASDPHARGH